MSEAIDKSSWGDGPWQQELDRLEWRHNGMPCQMVRHNTLGHWCGYVGVPFGHPWYGKHYSDDAINVRVHGGLTYAEKGNVHVGSIAQPGNPEHFWWFGFDCAHSGDVSPGMNYWLAETWAWDSSIYRTLAYVQNETNELAEQLQEVACLPK